MDGTGNDLADGLPLDQFADGKALDVAAFSAKYGNGFLLHQGPLEPERRPKRAQPTITTGRQVLLESARRSVERGPPPAPVRSLLIFPVRHTGRSPYPRIVTVGRTRNNDIILSDIAISKFHALFREEDGRFLVQDAGSRNGTFVDGAQVPETKKGKPVEVKPGAKVRFGEIEFQFVSGAQLRDLVVRKG
jgi:hypothetical protein